MDSSLGWKEWKQGDSHLINRIQWGPEEVKALEEKVLQADWFGYGKPQKEFEGKLAAFTGIPYVHLTNSGSAAIENALLALKKQGRWSPGDKVLHPVTTFATSISSAINLGLVPVFLETKPTTYVIDPEQVSKAIERYPEARGMVLPHLLGNIPDMNAITRSLGKHRFLLEDCCDTLGGTFEGKHVGSMGDAAAYSFYASHHITSGGVGGAVATRDKSLAEIMRSLTFWGRDFRPGDEEFLKRYTYSTLGLDNQMSAPQAAFGSAQMDRLPGFVSARKKQFDEMTELFDESGFFVLPETHPKASPSWFAYPLTVKESAPFDRGQFARYLTKSKVEVRPVMCGNITAQPPFANAKWLSLSDGRFPVGDQIEQRALFVPCWGMGEEQKRDYYKILGEFIKGYRS